MREQRRFDFRSGDVVAGRDDHVVGARLVIEVAGGVHHVGVARHVPAALDILALARVGEIAAARRSPYSEAADCAGRQLAAGLVNDARLITGNDAAGGSRMRVVVGCPDKNVQHLGRTETIHDPDPVALCQASNVAFGRVSPADTHFFNDEISCEASFGRITR
jgi:hypothetical protein